MITEFSADLDRTPDTLEDLKFILNLIAKITAESMEIELQFSSLEEKYRTLRMYGYPVSDDEAEIVDNIKQRWVDLCGKAKRRDHSLMKVKKEFTLVTSAQVSEFQKETRDWAATYDKEGPASGGIDLEKGLELLEQYTIALGSKLRSREPVSYTHLTLPTILLV